MEIWIFRDPLKCSGCRLCEIACSLSHEGRIWPEASRIKIFMYAPGIEFPHLCTQCHDYPCVEACPTEQKALSVDKKTGAVLVNREKCISCGNCIKACPGHVPFLHPKDNKATICDLCNGDPQCAKICKEGGWNALNVVEKVLAHSYKFYAKKPDELARELILSIYGKNMEELM